MKTFLFAAALLASASAATPAFAQDEPAPAVTVSGGVSLVSDYRFRGVSLSGKDPAIQGTINLNTSSGFYVGTWASSLEEDLGYGSTEVDLYAGYKTEVAPGTTIDAGLLYYAYPNADGLNYFEPYASITTTLGPATAKLGVAYAWDQGNIGNQDNLYVYGDVLGAIPESPVTLRAHVGYTDGVFAYGEGNYLDFNVGADIVTGPVTFGVSYIDTDLPGSVYGSDGAVVVSIGAAF
jgi:uncharacterized protein (TIGR02001 family)